MNISRKDFLKQQLEMRRSIKNGENRWKDLNDFRLACGQKPLHEDSLRKGALLLDEYDEAGMINTDTTSNGQYFGETVGVNSKGEISSEKKISLTADKLKDSNYLIKAHGFNPDEFEIISARSSFWGKEKGKDFYSSRISIRPKKESLTVEFLSEFFKYKDFEKHKDPVAIKQYDKNGEFLEVDVPDLHIGLNTTKGETHESYNIEEARERFIKCIYDIKERCYGKSFSKIYIAPLGDLLHFDNINGSTTKGTPQATDGRFAQVFNAAVDILIEGIDILGDIAPVHIMYVSGNHDKVLGYAAMVAIEKAYRKDDNVTVDTTPTSRKAIHEGNVLIGLAHGDMNKDRMAEWLQTEYRRSFGKSKYVEIHSGHFHSQQVIEKNGIIIRYLPTLCSSSPWEYDSGFNKSLKTLISFVWNKETGLREMWFSTPN